MKISFLVPDLGLPIVGIAARMAKFICNTHEVEIIGPQLWGHTHAMYSDEFAFRPVDCSKIYRIPEYFSEVRKLSHAIQGDVIFAMKVSGATLPAALLAKKERGCQVIAYLDEWDGATSASWSTGERIRHWCRDWMHPCNALYAPRVETRLPECDLRLGTTNFLRHKFDCQIFHIGVDTARFCPQDPAAVLALKRELGLGNKKVLVFGGVARPHKGLEVFADALSLQKTADCALLILGEQSDYVRQMQQHPRYGKYIFCPAKDAENTRQIHRKMPLYLGLGDVLIVPLTDSLMARSQMPCKVFEAMAMGKPIIASAVADLPQVLDGCGWLVPPDDVAALAERIQWVFANPSEAADMGERARKKCKAEYGQEVAGAALRATVNRVRSTY